jgi:hypothetical protein
MQHRQLQTPFIARRPHRSNCESGDSILCSKLSGRSFIEAAGAAIDSVPLLTRLPLARCSFGGMAAQKRLDPPTLTG